jgi:predicted nuclease with TOPRIM domain
MREAQDYKQKLAAAEESMLRNSNATDDAEVSSLRKAKDNMENKLRKYVAHCERLEVEKSNVVEALKSFQQDISVRPEEDYVEAIISVCDRLSSVEEECDALASVEERASSYLMELDRLRDDNSSLESAMAKTQERLLELTRSESQLASKWNQTSDEIAKLRLEKAELERMSENSKGSTQDLESVMNTKVQCLENENLQLHMGLKKAKKETQAVKAELAALQLGVDTDETEDLTGIFDKENKLLNGVTPKKPSSRKNAFSSVKKSLRKKSVLKSSTPARRLRLGEATEPVDDSTGECNQS